MRRRCDGAQVLAGRHGLAWCEFFRFDVVAGGMWYSMGTSGQGLLYEMDFNTTHRLGGPVPAFCGGAEAFPAGPCLWAR